MTCRLIGIRSKQSLADTLKIDLKDLKKISADPKKHFREFTDNSKGKPRQCQEPRPQLKRIHTQLKVLLSFIQPPDYVYSGRKKLCYVDNARIHIGNSRMTKMDISKFYQSCRREYIYRFFVDKIKMSHDTAEILTNISTFNGHIPTGSPVSQILAFLIHQDIFDTINSYAKKNGLTFSLYVDDLCFSGNTHLINSKLSVYINSLLKTKSLKLNRKKIITYGPNKEKLITGCIIDKNENLSAPDKLKKKIFQHIRTQNGNVDKISEENIRSTFGRVQAVKQIEGKFVFQNLHNNLLSELQKI